MLAQRRSALTIRLLIIGVVLGSCRNASIVRSEIEARQVSIQPTAATDVQCPEHSISILTQDTTIDSIPIAPRTAAIPEFHDCQRFMVDDHTYGPLVAIWASELLAKYFPKLPSGGKDSEAYAVAEILNYGTGPAAYSAPANYAPLALETGWSCVYLWRTAAPDAFTARMVHQDNLQDLRDCASRRPIEEVASAPRLSVRVYRPKMAPQDTVPPVARWDQDTTSLDQYIGIRCGDAWCEIGPDRGFSPSATVLNDAGRFHQVDSRYEPDGGNSVPPGRWHQMMQVKGWYDQQILERWDSSRGILVPSGVRATIIPNPVLDIIATGSTSMNFDNRWVPAAYIQLDRPYNGKHLQLQPGVSRVYLCHGAANRCSGARTVSGVTSTSNDLWWSKLVAPGGDVVYHSVYFNTHGGGVLPAGAARWRWQEDDATTWLRCDNGCCTDN